jgi:dTDP-4-dehydrorhamnose reductase
MSSKILITGSNGLLGQKLVKLLLKEKCDFLATSCGINRNSNCPEVHYRTLDVTNAEEIELVISEYLPSVIIHTAAMTNVDQCEQDHEGCDALNVEAVKLLWNCAKKHNCHFQLLSTDFVFDGKKGNYKETDVPAPLSYYGHSKYKAEQILTTDINTDWSIVRTIIVYGTGVNLSRSNLVLWAMEALSKGQEMKVVDDQFRSPTWADDLALGCFLIVKKQKKGIFHISGSETKSIYEWVLTVAKKFNWSTANVKPVSSVSLNQPAKRPPKTGFDLRYSRQELGYEPSSFDETLIPLFAEFNRD